MRPNDPNIHLRSMYWMPEAVLKQMTQDGNRRPLTHIESHTIFCEVHMTGMLGN